MAELKVACLGAGYFSQFHYQSWRRIDRVRLVGSCDCALTKAKATGLPAFSDLAQMLVATEPDVLDIILPPGAHAAAIETALEASVKKIICQKPFCQSRDEAARISERARSVGATIVVHENFRFQPWYRRIRRALQEEILGNVLQVTFRLRPGDGQGPHAYLDRQPYFQKMPRFLIHETGVHWIDTLRFLLGDPNAVYADLRQINPAIAGEDAGFVLFDHPGGVRALFDGNRLLDHAAENKRRTMGEGLVEGTKGTISLLGDGSLWQRSLGTRSETCLLSPDVSEGFGGDCVHALQTHAVNGFLDGSPLENRAEDYLKVLEIEDAVYRSAQQGSKISLAP
ncbi:MAG: Gfo/Idh/MocA family oxidoreductase [Pseudomonadota bacterium]